MVKKFKCPFKDKCKTHECILKIYKDSYYSPFDLIDNLKNINYIIPTFSITYISLETEFTLKCNSYTGKENY